ncbi:MAG TPA: hypothetical protein PKD10_17130 [Paracoccaceae bacterium]|nr:hypothetical protein [Paracoccaceae bacterium]HMO71319.1 hypothetical protein [Paracoccaceae bacterium]
MCHGDLDPKYLMRDIEARMKRPLAERDSTKIAAAQAPAGLVARLRDILGWPLRKDRAHV